MADNNPDKSRDEGAYLVGVGIADVTGPSADPADLEAAAGEPEV